jgi:4-hydroxybenzoyl-CoA thioesterase
LAAFEREMLVRFGHCDPGGWVFYPRYLEMVSQLVEDWFSDGLGTSLPTLVERDRLLTPSVHFTLDFAAPSRYGERLRYKLWVVRLGRASCELKIEASLKNEVRMTAKQVLVFISAQHFRADAIPEELARTMRGFSISPRGSFKDH